MMTRKFTFKKMLAGLSVVFGMLLSTTSLADVLLIRGATVHTMNSVAPIQNGDILVRDGFIEAVGTGLQAPADAVIIEAGGKPVTPGLFAGITELGLDEISAVDSSVDSGISSARPQPEFDVTPAFNPFSAAIPVTRIEGFTWSLLGAVKSGSIIEGQGQAVSLGGAYESFLGGPVLFIDIGADASEQSAGSRAAQWMQLEQAMSEAAAEVTWSPAPLLTLAGREALESFKANGTVVFNVDRASDILQVIKFSDRHGLNAVISGGTEAWMVADQLAEAGIPVLVNALSNLPASFDKLGARMDNAALLNAAGVTFAFYGMDTHEARKLRQVAGNAVANGLPWEAALAALTSNPAMIFGLGDEHGRIVPGNVADLVIWTGDPLEVTAVADQVFIGGLPMEMVSRQTLLRDRYLQESNGLPRAYVKP